MTGYGNVPERDDVRFNIVVRQTPFPLGGGAPDAADYPRMDEAKGETSGSGRLIINASYLGHTMFTEASPSTELRDYQIDLPATCGASTSFGFFPALLL